MTELPNTVAERAAELNRLREEPFWQRQREIMQGRIEPMESRKPRTLWYWLAACFAVVVLIDILRGFTNG